MELLRNQSEFKITSTIELDEQHKHREWFILKVILKEYK